MGVVNFPPAEQVIWVCQCGCSTFCLEADGGTHCASCLMSHPNEGRWERSPESPVRDPGDDSFASIQGNGSIEFARHRVSRLAQTEDVCAMVLVKKDGTIHTWADATTLDQYRWLRRRVAQALKLIHSGIRKACGHD